MPLELFGLGLRRLGIVVGQLSHIPITSLCFAFREAPLPAYQGPSASFLTTHAPPAAAASTPGCIACSSFGCTLLLHAAALSCVLLIFLVPLHHPFMAPHFAMLCAIITFIISHPP